MLSSRTRQATVLALTALGTLASVAALGSFAGAQQRTHLPPGGSNWVRQNSLVPGLVTHDMATGGQTAASLVQALVGTGVTITNIQFNGAPVAAGTFSGGTGIIGFEQGVILSSGNVASVVGPQNLAPDTSTDNLLPGDADLDALVTGLTQDACVLEFDFECPSTSVFSFQYVFSSEEYDEWVNTQYNDVFAFLLNGQNIALIPGTSTPVAINNVNCNNPYAPPTGQNCALYVTNACDSLGLDYPCTAAATEMDGRTVVFSATAPLLPGPNHIKLAIADRGDGVYDSNVFIRGQSFVCASPGPAFDPPSPCGQTLHATVGVPFRFEVEALATSGLPGQAVTLSVTGDSVPLAGGVFTPALPAGPAPEVGTEFEWTPVLGDIGTWSLQFTATDQIQQSTDCDVTIVVHAAPGTTFCYGDGSGTACPCNNDGNTHRGCANSVNADGGRLLATGVASVAADTLVLLGSGMPNGMCLYVQGSTQVNGGLGTQLGDGIKCTNTANIRLGIAMNALGSSQYPAAGDLPVSVRGLVPPTGGQRYYQIWYRNPDPTFCTGAMYNLTNGYSVLWAP